MRQKQALPRSKKNARWNGSPGLKGHRREAILRSVANVLRNSRLSSLTIQHIADELGMTKGNLYYYFKDKQDILYHCHMRSMEISLRALGRSPGKWPHAVRKPPDSFVAAISAAFSTTASAASYRQI